MKKKSKVVKKAGVGGKDVLVALDGVINSLEGMSKQLGESNLSYLRIALDNAVSVACQYRHDFEVFFEET